VYSHSGVIGRDRILDLIHKDVAKEQAFLKSFRDLFWIQSGLRDLCICSCLWRHVAGRYLGATFRKLPFVPLSELLVYPFQTVKTFFKGLDCIFDLFLLPLSFSYLA